MIKKMGQAGAYKQKQIDDWVAKHGDKEYDTARMQNLQTIRKQQTTEAIKAREELAKQTAQRFSRQGQRGAWDPSGGGGGLGATTAADRGTPGQGAHHFYKGGRVGFSKGGIVDLWQELSNL